MSISSWCRKPSDNKSYLSRISSAGLVLRPCGQTLLQACPQREVVLEYMRRCLHEARQGPQHVLVKANIIHTRRPREATSRPSNLLQGSCACVHLLVCYRSTTGSGQVTSLMRMTWSMAGPCVGLVPVYSVSMQRVHGHDMALLLTSRSVTPYG